MYDSEELLSNTTGHLVAIRLKSANKHIFRALLSIASAALLVRVFGMLNQIIVTERFGAGATMDAYFVASALPTLIASLVAGAIEASVIPAYAKVRARGREQASILFSTLMNILLLGSALLTVLLFIFRRQLIFLSAPALDPFRAELAVNLTPFILPALLLMIGISLLEYVLNTEGQFGWPAYAGLLVPLATAAFVLTLGGTQGVVILCIGIIVGLCLQLCVVVIRIRHAGLTYRWIIDVRNPAISTILVAAWPVLLAALISQASPLVDQIFASYLSPGSISSLNYALKLITVPVSVIFVSAGRAVLPYLSRQASIKDIKAFKGTLRLYLWAVAGGTMLLTAALLVLAHPLVQILFQRGAFSAEDTDRTASILQGFAIGLTPIALGFITARAFSALGRTRVLMSVTAFSVVANAIFDYIFARLWQGFGIALATSAVYCCTMFILFFMLQRTIGKLNLFKPPSELLNALGKISPGSQVENNHLFSFSIPYRLREQIVRVGIVLVVFAIGTVGALQNALYAVRAAFGSIIVLAFLRYRYVLLIAWVMLDVFIGSTLQIFQGNNIDTGLTLPTLLLMTCMPIQHTFQRMRPLVFLFIYLLWVFASIGISGLGLGTFLTSWLLLLDTVAVAVLVINLLTTRKRLLRLIDAILLLATIISLYGIYGYFTMQNGVPDSGTSLFRIGSIFGDAPTLLAFFLSMIIPLAIYRTFTLHGLKRFGGLMLVAIFLITLGLTFTRGALISVPLSILIMILFLPSGKMKTSLLIGIATLAVCMAFVLIVGNLPIFERFFNQDISTLNGRTYIWQALLDHFDPTNLLGKGLNASDTLLTNLRVGFGGGVIGTSSHNLFLGTLYDHGIIGVSLLTLTLAALAICLIRGALKATHERRELFAVALAVFVSVLLQSLDSNYIWNQSINIYFWIIMALPFALCWTASKQSYPTGEEAFDDDMTQPSLLVAESQNRGESFVSSLR